MADQVESKYRDVLGKHIDIADPGIGCGADAMHEHEIRAAVPGAVIAGANAVNLNEGSAHQSYRKSNGIGGKTLSHWRIQAKRNRVRRLRDLAEDEELECGLLLSQPQRN